MKYYLYKITNLVNERIYVGVHKTTNENDGYMGSGKILKAAIRKYGIENFKKDVLEEFDTAAAMFAREAEIVNQAFVDRPDVYNIKCGGQGGFDHINNNVALRQAKNKKARAKATETMMKLYGTTSHPNARPVNSSRFKQMHANGQMTYDNFKGRHHTSETKLKISAANKRRRGPGTSQFGTFWITDGTSNAKCRGDIPEGWYRGRRMSKSNKC